MKIWILSDLHCSLAELADLLSEPPEHDVCVLAGDLAAGLVSQIDLVTSVADKPVVIVPGNHEFWHRCLPVELMAAGLAAARHRRVHFLDAGVAVVGGVRFLGGTLWSDFNLYGPDARSLAMAHAVRTNSDFSLILKHDRSPLSVGGAPLWQPEDARQAHLAMRAFLDAEFAKPFDGPSVVVSHHAPSVRSIPPVWRGDSGSPAYASRLDDRIERWQPALWVHGHVHDSFDYRIGASRVVCNPAGISGENVLFNSRLVVEV